MPMYAPNLAGADSSQNYDTCNAPVLYQWQVAKKKKPKMTALVQIPTRIQYGAIL